MHKFKIGDKVKAVAYKSHSDSTYDGRGTIIGIYPLLDVSQDGWQFALKTCPYQVSGLVPGWYEEELELYDPENEMLDRIEREFRRLRCVGEEEDLRQDILLVINKYIKECNK
jgi:hypothetical protein